METQVVHLVIHLAFLRGYSSHLSISRCSWYICNLCSILLLPRDGRHNAFPIVLFHIRHENIWLCPWNLKFNSSPTCSLILWSWTLQVTIFVYVIWRYEVSADTRKSNGISIKGSILISRYTCSVLEAFFKWIIWYWMTCKISIMQIHFRMLVNG